jgi:hypothetical protein
MATARNLYFPFGPMAVIVGIGEAVFVVEVKDGYKLHKILSEMFLR